MWVTAKSILHNRHKSSSAARRIELTAPVQTIHKNTQRIFSQPGFIARLLDHERNNGSPTFCVRERAVGVSPLNPSKLERRVRNTNDACNFNRDGGLSNARERIIRARVL